MGLIEKVTAVILQINQLSEESTSGITSFGGVEPTQGSLEDGGWILKNIAHSDCNYL